MFPFEIPEGATLRSLVTEVFPQTHAKLVPASAGSTPFTIVLALEGEGSFTATVTGSSVTVREDEARDRNVWIIGSARHAERFLTDWKTERRFVPKFAPAGDVVLMSDPRVLSRLVMASGKIELALADLDGERVAMTIAFGAAAKKTIHPDDPDVTIEATVAVFEEILAGKLAPEDAIAEGRVMVKGKKLLAMQMALALAPLAPPKR
jgi:hypothetical protein